MTFEETWRQLRLRQAALIAAATAFLLAPFTLSGSRATEAFALPTAALLAVTAVAIGAWQHQLRCPACGQFFFRYVRNGMPIGGQNPFTRRCVNCRCPIGATKWSPGTSALESEHRVIAEAFLFKTDMFEVTKVGEHFINPRCFGEDCATWLSGRLTGHGITPSNPIQEDFGWVVMLPFRGSKFTLAIGIMDESIGCVPAEWSVAIGFEKPLNGIRSWFKKPPADDLHEVSNIVRTVLSSEPRILNLVTADAP